MRPPYIAGWKARGDTKKLKTRTGLKKVSWCLKKERGGGENEERKLERESEREREREREEVLLLHFVTAHSPPPSPPRCV